MSTEPPCLLPADLLRRAARRLPGHDPARWILLLLALRAGARGRIDRSNHEPGSPPTAIGDRVGPRPGRSAWLSRLTAALRSGAARFTVRPLPASRRV